jgi:hypothetical protein
MTANLYKMTPIAAMLMLPISDVQQKGDSNVQLPAYSASEFSTFDCLPSLNELGQTSMVANQQTEDSSALKKEFHSLVMQWKKETFAMSSLNKIYTHPAYQRIIGMGTAGLPFVLKELQNNQGRWFYALRFMAGEKGKEIPAGIKDFEEAKAAWLEWGYKNNYI